MTSKEQSLVNKLCPAVNSKNLIKFWYEDEDSDKIGWRIVEPHLIGVHKTTGNVLLRAWFIPDLEQTAKGWKAGWRLFQLEKITREQILAQKFNTRQGYNPKDEKMSQILCSTPIV